MSINNRCIKINKMDIELIVNNQQTEGWLRVLCGLVETSWGVLTDHGLLLDQPATCGRAAVKRLAYNGFVNINLIIDLWSM